MKFSLSWLKQYLETDASAEDVARTLNAIGVDFADRVSAAAVGPLGR